MKTPHPTEELWGRSLMEDCVEIMERLQRDHTPEEIAAERAAMKLEQMQAEEECQ